MKATGIVRKVDDLGRVVIPKELRTTFCIGIKDALEIFTEDDTIILRKYEPFCNICGNSNGLRNYMSKNLCSECIDEIKAL